MARIIRDEFRNQSGGFYGVVTIDARGDRRGIAVPPGQTVWLSEDEQIETANAPRSDADNPFTSGALVLVTSGGEIRNRRPLRPADEPPAEQQETGAAPQASGEPEQGSRPVGEEVATPEAVPGAGRRRRAPSQAA